MDRRYWCAPRCRLRPSGNFVCEEAGAANRTRTCDPVITNDVLYQLSYCGGPNSALRICLKTRAPDIGQRLILQEKRICPKPSQAGFCSENALIAPAGQEAAPAAGLARRRIDLVGEFVA